MVDDLFAVADAAGLERFHLVGESIGGTVALAAALARPERIATLTVSNGAHLGASIQRVEAWRRQLDEGGVKAWSDAFMPDRFHDGALSPRAPGLVRGAAGEMAARLDPQCARRAGRHRSHAAAAAKSAARPCCCIPTAARSFPVPIMAELHRLLPNAELNVIGHSRHGLPYSHADRSARRCCALFSTRARRADNTAHKLSDN